MNRLFVLIIACVLLGGAQVCAAQGSLRVGGGASVSQSPGLVQDAARPGIGGELGVHLPVRSWLRLVPTVSYHRARLDGEWRGSDGVMTTKSGTFNTHFTSPEAVFGVRPYAVAGVGLYRLREVPYRGGFCLDVYRTEYADTGRCQSVIRDTGFRLGLQLGGGLTIQTTSDVRLFGEVKHVRSSSPSLNPEGAPFTSLSVHAGLLYAW
jgi:hypothetical protein